MLPRLFDPVAMASDSHCTAATHLLNLLDYLWLTFLTLHRSAVSFDR